MNQQSTIARIEGELQESSRVKQSFSPELKEQIFRMSEQVAQTLAKGGTLYLMGNGGSAADAQHISAELVGKLQRWRKGLAAIALTVNTSVLTAIANDSAYDEIFSRQVEALVKPGDLLIGISTSGNSENVVRALRAGIEKKALTIAWTGEQGGRLGEVAQMCLRIPSRNTQRIQECHITLGHIMCGIVEDSLESPAK